MYGYLLRSREEGRGGGELGVWTPLTPSVGVVVVDVVVVVVVLVVDVVVGAPMVDVTGSRTDEQCTKSST